MTCGSAGSCATGATWQPPPRVETQSHEDLDVKNVSVRGFHDSSAMEITLSVFICRAFLSFTQQLQTITVPSVHCHQFSAVSISTDLNVALLSLYEVFFF